MRLWFTFPLDHYVLDLLPGLGSGTNGSVTAEHGNLFVTRKNQQFPDICIEFFAVAGLD